MLSEMVLKKLSNCFKLVDKFGWTDSIYTHISYQNEGLRREGHYLTNTFGKEFSNINPDDLVVVDYEGNYKYGSNGLLNPAGLIIHSEVHKLRPDMKCIIHTHSTEGVTFASSGHKLYPLNQLSCKFYEKISYHPYEGIVLDSEEMSRMAVNLGTENKVLVLKNHGVLVGGETIEEAFNNLYVLERAMEIQNKLIQMDSHNPLPHKVALKTREQFENYPQQGELEFKALIEKYGL